VKGEIERGYTAHNIQMEEHRLFQKKKKCVGAYLNVTHNSEILKKDMKRKGGKKRQYNEYCERHSSDTFAHFRR
jgi:hypothetical protein